MAQHTNPVELGQIPVENYNIVLDLGSSVARRFAIREDVNRIVSPSRP